MNNLAMQQHSNTHNNCTPLSFARLSIKATAPLNLHSEALYIVLRRIYIYSALRLADYGRAHPHQLKMRYRYLTRILLSTFLFEFYRLNLYPVVAQK